MRNPYHLATLQAFVTLLFVAGCGQSPTSSQDTQASADQVKGTPIRGEPIRPRAAASNITSTAGLPAPDNSTNLATISTNSAATNVPAILGRDGDHLLVGFEYLSSYNYVMPDESAGPSVAGKDQIPTHIRSLDKKSIALKGFMLPLKVESGLVSELLLMRDQSMCCYGSVPKINEWVSVKMEKGVKPVMDSPVTIYGNLQVGELRENGYLVGLYQMAGERMKEN